MATFTYNKKTRTFTVIWKDHAKEALGVKYPYGRKSKKWLGDKAPSASEKRAIEKELLKYADEEESKSKGQASFIRVHGKTDEITAAGYLMNLKDEELTITKDKTAHRVARHRINTFINWLNKKHRGLALHQVNSAIASDYYKYLESERLAYATIQHHIARLRFVFNDAMIKYENSPLKPSNPFATRRLHKVITKVEGHKRKSYENEQLQKFLLASTKSNHLNKWQLLQRFATYYFLMVTGWRVNDILRLKWESVDLQQRIIKHTHRKTKNKRLQTELGITDLMHEILLNLKEMQQHAPDNRKEFVFSLYTGNADTSYGNLIQHFARLREKWGLNEHEELGQQKTYTYTIHSFRGTVITRLTQARYQEARINYLVGHAPNNTETKHYLDLKAADTIEMIEHMERLSNADEIANEIEIIKQKRDEIRREEERQELLRKKNLLEKAKAAMGQAEWERIQKLHEEADKYFTQPERLAQENKMNELQQLIYRLHQVLGEE